MTSKQKTCFVIAPIGEPESETRQRSDLVLQYIIREAIEPCGYVAIRADEIDRPGIITTQVIQHIVEAPLVIADLTERNPNVFYELALRHALRRPLIQLISKGEVIPFDVAGTRTIQVDHRDLASVRAAKSQIVKQVQALENDPFDVESPISVALDLQSMRQSGSPEARSLVDVIDLLGSLRQTVTAQEAHIARISQVRTVSGKRQPSLHQKLKWLGELLDEVGAGDPIVLLYIGSTLRDDYPWIYEACFEAHRRYEAEEGLIALDRIENVERLLTRHPPSLDHRPLSHLASYLDPLWQGAAYLAALEMEPDELQRRPEYGGDRW
jgi:hypothetical protein